MNRRKFIAAMAAGGIVTAEGLWIPGQKMISIPAPKIFHSRRNLIFTGTASYEMLNLVGWGDPDKNLELGGTDLAYSGTEFVNSLRDIWKEGQTSGQVIDYLNML